MMKKRAAMGAGQPTEPTNAVLQVSYTPLERFEIRILSLLPGNESLPITCSLRTVSLADNNLNYVALSWTWGPKPSNSSIVTINGMKHAIRPNLHHALLNLRQETEERHFWIDAICINQQDETEKPKQIPLMSQIYSMASHVAVWLGPSADDSDFVMDCLQRNAVPNTARFYDGIFKILLRPWFERSWVLQEFALNPMEPEFFVGRAGPVRWSRLREVGLATIQNTDLVNKSSFHGSGMTAQFTKVNLGLSIMKSAQVKYHRPIKENTDDPTVSHWIYYLKYMAATDARDKVFSLLGLVSPEVLVDFLDTVTISYSKPLMETYRDTTLFLLNNERSFRAYLHYWTFGGNGSSGPSWILDFNCPYHAARTVFDQKETFEFIRIRSSEDRNRLFVKAILLDDIADVLELGDFTDGWGPVGTEATKVQQRAPLTRAQYVNASLVGLALAPIGYVTGVRSWRARVRSARNCLKYVQALRCIDDIIRRAKMMDGMPLELAEPLWKTITCNLEDRHKTDETFPDKFEVSLQFARNLNTFSPWDAVRAHFHFHHFTELSRKTFFMGGNGFYGMTDTKVQKGDVVALLFPDKFVPFILRPKGSVFEMVGPAYIPSSTRETAISQNVEGLREITIV